MSKEPREVKVVVLGASNTGRRALIRKYVDSVFTERYEPFDDSAAYKQVTIDGEPYLIGLFFADLESYTKIELGDAFILLYAVNDRGSFIGTRDLYQVLQQTRAKATRSQKLPTPVGSGSPPSVPIYLVGSKIDLESERQVTLDEAKDLAIELRCRKLFETSAKTHTDEIDDLFSKLVRELPRSSPQRQQQQQQQRQQQQQEPKQPQQQKPLELQSAYQRQLQNTQAAQIGRQSESTRPDTMSSQAPGSTSSPSVSPRRGGMLDRFKFGSLRRTPSMQSMRKKSDSFGETMRRLNSPSSSRDNLRSTSGPVPTLSTSKMANGSLGTTATRTNSTPWMLNVDTSAWRETVKWPTEIIPEEELRMK